MTGPVDKCPFCGSHYSRRYREKIREGGTVTCIEQRVQCAGCGALGPPVVVGNKTIDEAAKEAIAVWNRRAKEEP